MSGAFGLGALISQGLNLPEALIFNTADPIVLGNIVLEHFAIPERINWGGSQKTTVHMLPGGERVIDAMGREEDAISWSGLFLGRTSIEQAKALDVMRAAGNRYQFSFGTLSYTVLIKSFQAEYKFAYQIPYKISLEIVRDNAAPVPDNTITPEQSISDDVASADDSLPKDAPQNVATKTKVESVKGNAATKGTTVTKTYQPIDQVAPTVENANIAAGNNLPGSAYSLVDLGPQSSLAGATPASLTAQGIGVGPSMASAQSAADSLLISNANASLFGAI